jgi:DNA-binding transcriptional LysR family regulator
MREAHLRDFIAVVETGSLRSAARKLGISQAAISKNLSALERSCGVPLLVRSAHGVEPTDFGRILVRRARLADAELRKAQEEMAALSGEHRGVVNVGLSSTAEVLLAARAIQRFQMQRPTISVNLLGGNAFTMAGLLREGKLDFAVVPAGKDAAGSDLHALRLLSTELVIVTRAEHPAARAEQLKDLQDCQWILGARPGDNEPAIVAAFAQAGLPPPRFTVQRESFSALIYLLLQTDFVAVTSYPAVEPFCRPGQLAVVPVKVRFPPMVQYLLTSAIRPLTANAELLASEFRRARRGYRR